MKTSIGVGIAVLAASALAAAPAQASPYSLDTMSSSMMSASQASSLGVAGNHVRDFQYLEGTKQSPDDFWLCDVAGKKQIEVDGPPEMYVVAYASTKSRVETVAGQDLYTFDSEADARTAMKAIRKAATKCAGTYTVEDEGFTLTQKLSNGTGKTADGKSFTWIKQVATASDATSGLAEHEYNTFRRVGQFVQVISIEVVGVNPPKLTSSQIKTADRLTGTLGSAWTW